MLDWTAINALLALLFGQMGPLGTTLFGAAAGMYLLLLREQKAHHATQEHSQKLNAKNHEFALRALTALNEFRTALETLARESKRDKADGKG